MSAGTVTGAICRFKKERHLRRLAARPWSAPTWRFPL